MSIVSLVNKATDPRNQMEDWDSILQLCDMLVQQPDETGKTLSDAIIKKVQADHPKTRYFAISLLDSCVKNGSRYFHESLMRNKHYSKLNIMARNDSDSEVREKWEEVCREWQSNYPNLYQTLVLLASSPFPSNTSPSSASSGSSQSSVSPSSRSTTTNTRNEKLKKLMRELQTVEENCVVLNSMIDEANSPNALLSNDSAQQVYANLVEIKRRLIVLIEKIPSEEVLLQSLEAHDGVSDTIERYEQFNKKGVKLPVKQKQAPQQPQQSQQQNLLDDSDDIFNVNNKGKNPTSQQSGDLMSLDDFLGPSTYQQPPVSSRYQQSNDVFSLDSIGIELNNIQQQQQQQPEPSSETSSGFAALARRRASKKIVEDVVTSPAAEPNPFAEDQNISQPVLFNPLQSGYPQPQYDPNFDPNYNQQQQQSGFASLARRNQQQSSSSSGYPPLHNQQQTNNDDDPFF